MKAKIAADMSALKANVAHVNDPMANASRAAPTGWSGKRASRSTMPSSVEQAKLATLDAIVGRIEAEQARQT